MIDSRDILPTAGDHAEPATEPGVGWNVADVAVDRHVRAGHGADTAVRWIGRDRADLDDPLDVTFEMLASRSSRFANALRRYGIEPGSTVATLLGRVPDHYVAAVGTWKARCVFTALLASSGTEAVAERLRAGRIDVLVTTPQLLRRTVVPILDRLPELRLVLVCGASEDRPSATARVGGPVMMSCGAFVCDSTDDFVGETTGPDEPATMAFAEARVGLPTAVLHDHRAVADDDQAALLDLHRDDRYWCTTDPSSVTGIAHGVVGAMSAGATSIVDESEFHARRWMHILGLQHVDVLAAVPAALRWFRDATDGGGDTLARSRLRTVATVGERLDPATTAWATTFLGASVLEPSWTAR